MKIAILGDSISEGLGSKHYNYVEFLLEYLKTNCLFDTIEIKNLAHTGTGVQYGINVLPQLEQFEPDVVICMYGIVDAMISPDKKHKPNYYNLLPKRYKGNGMLNPRPFYSSNKFKALFQHIDSYTRLKLGHVLLRLQGGAPWVNEDEFEKLYNQLMVELQKYKMVFICSTVCADEKYYPGTPQNCLQYNKIIRSFDNGENIFYCNIYDDFCRNGWDEVFGPDHFHPSYKGYQYIGNYFGMKIEEHRLCLEKKNENS